MLIPFSDTENSRYGATPMSTIIIIVCVLVWGLQTLLLYRDFDGYYWMIYHLGANPQQTLTLRGFGGLTAITATFLHGGFAHLLFNMWALRVLGRRVEDACGPWRFLAFYLFCGATCNIAFTMIHADSDLPAIGASGAIYGVMAAYLFLYPDGRIRMLILTPYPFWPRVRAFWVVLFFFITAMLSGLNVLVNQADFRTAHWGHLGGFFGAVTILFFLRPEAFRRYINHLSV
jgi:membrane associated rhomboid family serine protease